ncbi:hypothetical protein, partial [Stenotrophomonas maltophilia]|uniref:hypothetical protein n=1 Tax=Stenotrophomonas maltophilia TaxID=40324 RepID=UPI001953C5B0
SNQLSYNCILARGPAKRGAAISAETRCNAALWQGRNTLISALISGRSTALVQQKGPDRFGPGLRSSPAGQR